MRKCLLLFSLLALATLTLLPAMAQDNAAVRIAHFSPDAPAVDIYVDGVVAVAGLQFTEVTAFLELTAGSHSIAIALAGTALDTAVIDPLDLVLDAGTFTTIAAIGSAENETLTTTVFTEAIGAAAAGQASITFLHTIEGEGGLDLYGSSIQLIQSIRYPDAAAGRDGAFSREVPPGQYDFDASIAENPAAIMRELHNVPIEAGENYLIVALGPQANEGTLLVVTPAGYSVETEGETTPNAEAAATAIPTAVVETVATTIPAVQAGETLVRVGHFVPDAPAVDIYVDGVVAVEGLEFPEVTAFMPLAAGSHIIAMAVSGTALDAAVLDLIDVTFEPDTHITLAAIGSLENETLTATVFTEDFDAIPAGQARITLLHTIEGESGVDLYGSSIQLIQSIRYPDAAAGRDGAFTRDVPAGRYNFDVTVAENAAVVLREVNGVEIAAGDTLLLVALGPQSNEGVLLVVTPAGYQNPEE
jgi:trimeric autotransporter adhesin